MTTTNSPRFSLSMLLRLRFWIVVVGITAIAYSCLVMLYVPTVPDLGLRTAFGTTLLGKPKRIVDSQEYQPRSGDVITRVGEIEIDNWLDILRAPLQVQQQIAKIPRTSKTSWLKWSEPDKDDAQDPIIRVQFSGVREGKTETFDAWCQLGELQWRDMLPSMIWFVLKAALFLVGALVFWKRPQDAAAGQFFLVCAAAMGAYMGGYHWFHIATQPVLLLVFMICGILLPVVGLHFYCLFPRRKAFLEKLGWKAHLAIYALPVLVLTVMIVTYAWLRTSYTHDRSDHETIIFRLALLKYAVFTTLAVAFLWYGGCIVALIHSYRTAVDSLERNQVKFILGGSMLALLCSGISLALAFGDPDSFAEGGATWPMFAASCFVTAAFAISITRYRLMEVDKILDSSVSYFLASFLAGILYYAVVFLGTLIFNQVIAGPSFWDAISVSTTALIFMLFLDQARSRFRKVLDRSFSRNKSQLDETLQQMSQAVAQLVDPPALAQRLLHATTQLLGTTQGAVYLRVGEPAVYKLAAQVGSPPALDEIPANFPIILALEQQPRLQPGSQYTATMAQRQLQFLNGELAQPLMHNGRLIALLILGPRGTPYTQENWNLLSAFAQITVLALESATGHRIIEGLNRELQAKVDKIAEQQRRILALQSQLYRQNTGTPEPAKEEKPAKPVEEPAPEPLPGGMVGSSPVVRMLYGTVRKVAATDAVVLLRGESGTGKELLARAVHDSSARAAKPYVIVHCAALSANLLESELFGHVKGSFTGAHRDKAGRFEMASGGTLFLDEIGDVSLEVQTKLLRVLQEKTFERVGSNESIQADVRIIAATHQNLEELIKQGRFRADLFYRLNVFPIVVPPLRERREDIAELAQHFVKLSAERCRKNIQTLDDEALSALKAFDWPGNIRQLENVVERAVVIAEDEVLTVRDLPDEIHAVEKAVPKPHDSTPVLAGVASTLKGERNRMEREQLMLALSAADGNKAEAARALGMARSTLISRMKKLGLL